MILYELRKRTGKTQAQVANDLGIGISTYGHYEKGRNEPDLATLIKLADYFHVTLDVLVNRNVPYLLDKSLLTDLQCKVVDSIIELRPDEVKAVDNYIKTTIDNR